MHCLTRRNVYLQVKGRCRHILAGTTGVIVKVKDLITAILASIDVNTDSIAVLSRVYQGPIEREILLQ